MVLDTERELCRHKVSEIYLFNEKYLSARGIRWQTTASYLAERGLLRRQLLLHQNVKSDEWNWKGFQRYASKKGCEQVEFQSQPCLLWSCKDKQSILWHVTGDLGERVGSSCVGKRGVWGEGTCPSCAVGGAEVLMNRSSRPYIETAVRRTEELE